MSKQKRNVPPPPRNFNFFMQLWETARLSWALFFDPRVPMINKIVPLLAIAYLVSPLDLVPFFLPIVGQLDDIGIMLTALSIFNGSAPNAVVEEHLRRFRNPVAKPTGSTTRHRVTKDKDGGVIIDTPAKSRLAMEDEEDDEPLVADEQSSTAGKRSGGM
jgi:uncharacterized membrane protein YkvA (DUF1232 family)